MKYMLILFLPMIANISLNVKIIAKSVFIWSFYTQKTSIADDIMNICTKKRQN